MEFITTSKVIIQVVSCVTSLIPTVDIAMERNAKDVSLYQANHLSSFSTMPQVVDVINAL
jgi:hypothetical protein